MVGIDFEEMGNLNCVAKVVTLVDKVPLSVVLDVVATSEWDHTFTPVVPS